jgi:DNA-binding FrmR family transcriptional regulator
MNNGEPIHSLDIQQLKWALRAGKVDVWESTPVEKQLNVVAEDVKNTIENPPICTTVLEQISAIEKLVNQQMALFRNEFAVFIQAQVNQEKALRLSETEWQKKLIEHESKMLAEMWEMRQSIIGEFTTYFQLIAEQLQTRDQLIHKEVSLLKEQLTEMHQYQEYHKEQDLELAKEWNQKIEACQIQLINCMQHIQKVLEEINIGGIEKQKQEEFFLKEIAIVKSEVANLRQTYQSKESRPIIVDMEPCTPTVTEENGETKVDVQQGIEVEQYMITKKKRRHRRG